MNNYVFANLKLSNPLNEVQNVSPKKKKKNCVTSRCQLKKCEKNEAGESLRNELQ